MRIAFALLLLAFSWFCARAETPVRGVALAMASEDSSLSYEPFIKEIAGLGASHISLVIPYYQRNAESVRLYAKKKKTPGHDEIVRTCLQAREHGLDVMLFPIVLLEEDTDDDWRGSLRPAEISEWFAVYTEMVAELAMIGEETGAVLLSVGSEFASLEKEEARWREVCRAARTHFDGELVYTSNWDTPDSVGWWDAVDYMGISGYFELAEPGDNDATTEALAREWGMWKRWLLGKRAAVAPEKKILFSEIGYPSMDGGAALPWDYTRDAPVDLEEQRRAFEAFIRTWDGEADYAGCFVYTWIDFGSDPARGYSPRGKPSEELLREWWQ